MPPHHSHHSFRGSRHTNRSGRGSNYWLYETPAVCYCDGVPCLCPLDVGGLEKDNPLPPGRYWVDVFGLNIPKADDWFKTMAAVGVHVDATEHFEATEVPNVRNWYLFTYKPNGTLIPPVWDQKTFGFPTVAGPEIKSSADTAQTPPLSLDPLDQLADFAQSIGSMVGVTSKVGAVALTAGLFIGSGVLLFDWFKEKRKK